MSQALKDAEELKQWILRKFGAPLLKVELTEDFLEDCVEDARRWFAAKKGFKAQTTMTLNGQVYYDLPEEVDTVLDIAFTASGYDLDRIVDPLGLVDGFPQRAMGGFGDGMGLLSSYAQVTQYIHQAKRVLGAEMEWWQEGRKLVVLPVTTSGTIRLDYKAHAFTIEQLNERDYDLVKRKALANAKEMLGRIRSRFDAFPTAQGSVSLDGAALLSEAADDKEKLEEEISQSGYPMGFVRG